MLLDYEKALIEALANVTKEKLANATKEQLANATKERIANAIKNQKVEKAHLEAFEKAELKKAALKMAEYEDSVLLFKSLSKRIKDELEKLKEDVSKQERYKVVFQCFAKVGRAAYLKETSTANELETLNKIVRQICAAYVASVPKVQQTQQVTTPVKNLSPYRQTTESSNLQTTPSSTRSIAFQLSANNSETEFKLRSSISERQMADEKLLNKLLSNIGLLSFDELKQNELKRKLKTAIKEFSTKVDATSQALEKLQHEMKQLKSQLYKLTHLDPEVIKENKKKSINEMQQENIKRNIEAEACEKLIDEQEKLIEKQTNQLRVAEQLASNIETRLICVETVLFNVFKQEEEPKKQEEEPYKPNPYNIELANRLQGIRKNTDTKQYEIGSLEKLFSDYCQILKNPTGEQISAQSPRRNTVESSSEEDQLFDDIEDVFSQHEPEDLPEKYAKQTPSSTPLKLSRQNSQVTVVSLESQPQEEKVDVTLVPFKDLFPSNRPSTSRDVVTEVYNAWSDVLKRTPKKLENNLNSQVVVGGQQPNNNGITNANPTPVNGAGNSPSTQTSATNSTGSEKSNESQTVSQEQITALAQPNQKSPIHAASLGKQTLQRQVVKSSDNPLAPTPPGYYLN